MHSARSYVVEVEAQTPDKIIPKNATLVSARSYTVDIDGDESRPTQMMPQD